MSTLLMRRIVSIVSAAGILVNTFYFFGNASAALAIYRLASGVPTEDRRMLYMPSLYRDVQRIERLVPENATLWYVAPFRPHVIAYFLYPRMIRWGSPNPSDLDKIRHDHPGDWVLSDHNMDPAKD